MVRAAEARALAAPVGSARRARPSASSSVVGHGPARLGDGGRQDDQGRHLGHERLGRGDRDLRSGLQEQDRVGLAGDGRPDRVGDRDDRTAPLAGKAGRGDRVGRLARLGDGDDQRVRVERRRAVAELRADVRADRQAGPVLERGGPDERGVEGAAAGDELDPGDVLEALGQPGDLVDHDPVVPVDPPGDALAQRLGLLVDLLEHEVLVAALLGGLGRPVDGRHGALARGAVHVGDGHAPRPQVGHVAILEEDDPVGVGEDRRDVGGEKGLAVAETDDERHVLAGADQPVALADVHDREGVRTLELAEGVTDGIGEVALVRLLDEVGDRLRVGLRGEDVAARLESVAQLAEVLDDPVVDDRDGARAVAMRMGVQVVRPAVRRPAGVGQPDRGVGRAIGEGGLEVDQLARPLLDEQVAGVVDEGDPGRIVAAVLEPLEPLDEDGARLPRTRVADDAAHTVKSSARAAGPPVRRQW